MSFNIESSIPKSSIKVSYYDVDGKRIDNISISQANEIAKLNPSQKFLFQNGEGSQVELLIEEVNNLQPSNLVSTSSACPSGPQTCGPPLVQFFGGGGFGATANAIVSPITNSIIGFDIINRGKNYKTPPSVNIYDICGNGSGARASANLNENGELESVAVDSPGDEYLAAPNGSLGGNERVWKEFDEGYVLTADGNYYVVPFGREPTLNEGDTYFPPQLPPSKTQSIYPVVLAISEIKVVNPGFGYRPDDRIIVSPDKGSILQPIINQYGEIEKINVLNPGLGFDDLPDIGTNSQTGFNAQLLPILKVIPLEEISDQIPPGATIISVVDCVGKVPPQTIFELVPR